MDKKQLSELENLPFEQALKQLEDIVDKMETGNLTLDDMISQFETGNALSKICGNKLNALQKKIEVLVKEDATGGQWTEFDASSQRQNQMTVDPQQSQQAGMPPENVPPPQQNIASDGSLPF